MAPRGNRNFPENPGIPNPAAVLILLFPVSNVPYIVFMKRAEYPGIHSGQISLPGGRTEKGDTGLENTALRETTEELGIVSDNIKIIGKLSPLLIPVSGFVVHPFVGVVPYKPKWEPDKNEVSYLIESPVVELASRDNIKNEIWKLHGRKVEVPFYLVKDEKIWGATAMIISEFLEIMKSFS
jgi:8-oxo-dGTP pyrophosphatase MutT (NUDIX family)